VRSLFFALLFVNLAWLAWAYWASPALPTLAAPAATAGTAAAKVSAAVPLLELVPIDPASSATVTRCRSIGPFADAGAATVAGDMLRSRGWQPRDRNVETSVPDGYWVYIGQLTLAAQRIVLARLNAAGIHDAASMTQPEQSDRVSVGFFGDQAHAVRRAEQVRELGYKPVLDLHRRSVSTHWLDVDLKTADSDPQPKQFQNAAGLQVVDCPVKGAAD
jgi:hypothetical protein